MIDNPFLNLSQICSVGIVWKVVPHEGQFLIFIFDDFGQSAHEFEFSYPKGDEWPLRCPVWCFLFRFENWGTRRIFVELIVYMNNFSRTFYWIKNMGSN